MGNSKGLSHRYNASSSAARPVIEQGRVITLKPTVLKWSKTGLRDNKRDVLQGTGTHMQHQSCLGVWGPCPVSREPVVRAWGWPPFGSLRAGNRPFPRRGWNPRHASVGSLICLGSVVPDIGSHPERFRLRPIPLRGPSAPLKLPTPRTEDGSPSSHAASPSRNCVGSLVARIVC